MAECVDAGIEKYGPCCGPVIKYPALSGSGEVYPRCAAHYERYQDRIEAISRRHRLRR